MIAMLTGKLLHYADNRGVLDVHGVGYEVFATRRALQRWLEHASIQIHVSTQVRDDAIALYGFDEEAERRSFLALLGVAGVGPKVALAALDTLGADGLADAVQRGDIRTLCSIPGVGKKTAQRMALELSGKLLTPPPVHASPASTAVADPLPLALAQLGYKKSEIDAALAALERAGITADVDTGERLRHALKTLSSHR